MKKIVCEMCECTEFVKEDGMFVCQECGCKYSPEDARKMMVEVADAEEEPRQAPVQEEEEEDEGPRAGFPLHTPDSPNRIAVTVEKVGHETYTMRSVTSLSALFGEPEPEFVAGPDQVGHIGTAITIRNLAGKPIKYIVVYLTPYNAVGDAVSCTVQGHSTFGIEVTGPLPVGETWEGYSDGMWYNNSIVTAKVAFATVEYLDGTKELFEAESLVAQESTNEDIAIASVVYDCNAGAPQILMYTIDNGQKFSQPKGSKEDHYLKPGYHVLNILNPFMKQEYRFKVQGTKIISIYGKTFSMEISEP